MILNPPQAPAALAAYRSALETGTPEAVLLGTSDYFASACDAQVVPVLTIDADDLETAPPDTEARIRSVRDRLRRLGYPLPRLADPAEGAWGPDVSAILARFGFEAGLPTPDFAAGELTAMEWNALQQLFSFECPLKVSDWFDGTQASGPLRRAVRLRLSVLGFGTAPGPTDFEPASSALADFADLAFRLGVTTALLPTALTPAFVATLFDHDDLVERLSQCSPRLAAISFFSRHRAESFLVCVAKVELWLFGYDIKPDGTSDLTTADVHGPRETAFFHPNDTANAIASFWRETQPQDGALHIGTLGVGAIPEQIPVLLARMVALHRDSASQLPQEHASDTLVAQITARLSARPSLWTDIESAATRMMGVLFDGMRRAFSWVHHLFSQAWDAATTETYNLWRTLHHFMGSAAFNLRRALAAMNEGAAFMVHPLRASAPEGCAVLSRHFVGNAFLLVDPAAEPAEVTAFGRGLVHGAKSFAIACRIFAIAVTAIRTALCGAAATLGGFVPMILGLASICSQVRVLIAQLDALDASDEPAGLAPAVAG